MLLIVGPFSRNCTTNLFCFRVSSSSLRSRRHSPSPSFLGFRTSSPRTNPKAVQTGLWVSDRQKKSFRPVRGVNGPGCPFGDSSSPLTGDFWTINLDVNVLTHGTVVTPTVLGLPSPVHRREPVVFPSESSVLYLRQWWRSSTQSRRSGRFGTFTKYLRHRVPFGLPVVCSCDG